VNDTNDDRCPNIVPATCGECWATTAMGIISSIGTKVIHIEELKKCMCERVSLGTGDEPLNKNAGKGIGIRKTTDRKFEISGNVNLAIIWNYYLGVTRAT
jgi:hypothetical protein